MLLVVKASGQYNPQDGQFPGEWPQIGNHHLAQSVKKICFTYVFIQFYTFIQCLFMYTIFIQYLYINIYFFDQCIYTLKVYFL